jgi:hypothetical protein
MREELAISLYVKPRANIASTSHSRGESATGPDKAVGCGPEIHFNREPLSSAVNVRNPLWVCPGMVMGLIAGTPTAIFPIARWMLVGGFTW